MNVTLSMVGKIIAWILFVATFAAIGLATENPAVMVPVYGISIIVILGAILFFLSRKKKQTAETVKIPAYISLIEGIFLLLFSLAVPVFVMGNSGALYYLNISSSMTILFTLLLIGLGILGVWLINVLSQKIKIMSFLGYLMIIFVAALPAIAIAPIDASARTLGVLYFVVMLLGMTVWFGFSLCYKTIKGQNE